MDSEVKELNTLRKPMRIRKKKRFVAIRKVLRKLDYYDIVNIAFGVVIGDLIFEGLKALVHLF